MTRQLPTRQGEDQAHLFETLLCVSVIWQSRESIPPRSPWQYCKAQFWSFEFPATNYSGTIKNQTFALQMIKLLFIWYTGSIVAIHKFVHDAEKEKAAQGSTWSASTVRLSRIC